MAISLDSLVDDSHEFEVVWQGEPIQLVVRPSAVTPALGRVMRTGEADDALVQALTAVVVSWDVVDAQGAVTVPDTALLETLPSVFLSWLLKVIGEELAGKAQSAISGDGS